MLAWCERFAAAPPADSYVQHRLKGLVVPLRQMLTHSTEPAPATADGPGGWRVVVREDSRAWRSRIRRVAEGLDHEVEAAHGEADALARLERPGGRAVLITGARHHHLIRQARAYRLDAPVIVLTAADEAFQPLYRLGVEDFILKDVHAEGFLRAALARLARCEPLALTFLTDSSDVVIHGVRVKLTPQERLWLEEQGADPTLRYRVLSRIQEATSRAGRPIYVRYDLPRAVVREQPPELVQALVVEDHTWWRERLRALLETLGLSAFPCATAADARAWAAQRRDPYLLCLDLELEEGQGAGFRLLDELWPETAVILSAHERTEVQAEAARRRVHFIGKAEPDWDRRLTEVLWELRRGRGKVAVIRWDPSTFAATGELVVNGELTRLKGLRQRLLCAALLTGEPVPPARLMQLVYGGGEPGQKLPQLVNDLRKKLRLDAFSLGLGKDGYRLTSWVTTT